MSERTAVTWDAALYHRFRGHRLRPAIELFAHIDHDSPRVVHDLGCGGGEIARLMAARWPDADVVGSDLSPEMLAKASAVPGRVRWEKTDVATWRPDGPVDVIYANAVLHWLADHKTLFPRLFGYLTPGGVLAVQMPISWDEPSHRLMREVLASGGPDGTPLGGEALRSRMNRRPVARSNDYYELLAPLAAKVEVWETHYLHVLEGQDPVFDWVSGTGLRPVLEGLQGDDLERFVGSYRARLREAYARRAGGETLYRFPRLFVVATK